MEVLFAGLSQLLQEKECVLDDAEWPREGERVTSMQERCHCFRHSLRHLYL
jgi:hypothetical protein